MLKPYIPPVSNDFDTVIRKLAQDIFANAEKPTQTNDDLKNNIFKFIVASLKAFKEYECDDEDTLRLHNLILNLSELPLYSEFDTWSVASNEDYVVEEFIVWAGGNSSEPIFEILAESSTSEQPPKSKRSKGVGPNAGATSMSPRRRNAAHDLKS